MTFFEKKEKCAYMKELLQNFLGEMERYIKLYEGGVRDAFNFSKEKQVKKLIQQCPEELLRHKEKDAYMFRIYEPLKLVYILLEGNCGVEKYKTSGAVVTDNARRPLQMFGLFEGLSDISYHTVTMRCITDCTYISVPKDILLDILHSDPKLMWMIMQFLSCFIADYIDSSDLLILNDPEVRLLSKLYRYCIGKNFPVTVLYRKEELARDLNMNLRTMYRYLDKFYQDGMLDRWKGKIVISKKQHQMIGDYLKTEE